MRVFTLLLFTLFFSSQVFAETFLIDERKTDIYFANGVGATSKFSSFMQGYNQVDKYIISTPSTAPYIGKYDLAFNTGHGVLMDMFEAWLQYTDEHPFAAITWSGFKEMLGRIPGVGNYASASANLNEAVALTFEAEDIAIQVEAYKKSISAGHGVLVLAHSQGNFFTNKAYDPSNGLKPWMQEYFVTVGLASPSDVHIPNSSYYRYDNDPISALNGVGSDIRNPKRHFYFTLEYTDNHSTSPCPGTVVDDGEVPTCYVENSESYESEYYGGFHLFDFYMETSTSDIYQSLTSAINLHNSSFRSSQWEKSEELGCGCDKRIYVEHKHDTSLNQLMNEIDVVAFDEILKLYPIEGQYYKGSYEGDSVQDHTQKQEGELCMELLDIDTSVIDEMLGKMKKSNPNSGVVEISLKWDNEEVDLDLNVGWDAGSVDVKDICDPFEHFHIRSESTIYPGTYGVSIMPKDSSAKIFDDPSIYPLTVELVTRTPGASDSMRFTIKSKSDINLGHVSNIKVYREDEEDDDTNDENGGDDEGTGGSSAFFIAPSVAPNCPPVNHTPSPIPPKAIYFSSGSSGGYSFHGGGGGGGYSGGSGGYSGGSGYAAQSDPRCSGDIECIGGATDFHNNSNATGQTQMQAPFSPRVGGEPVRNIVEEDSCEGGLSCKCIPCEYEIIPLKKQANYGPIRGADFSIYTLDGYRTQSSIYDGVTSYGETLYDAGEIDIPQGILETLEDEIFYVIKVQGGEDIDRDDDFVIDTTPTQNLGKAYALIKGEDIKNTGFKINILTTVTFTLLEDMIQKDATAQQLEEKIEEIASRLLRYKIYPQSEESNISNEDLLAWLPAIDKDLLLQSYEPLDAMVEKIYANESIYEEAYEYVYLKSSDDNSTQSVVDEYKPPIIKTFVASIPEDAVGGTILGSIEILRGSEDLTFASLSGKGSELFTIDVNGEIKLKEDAKLDYETKWLYNLKAEAINKNGSSGKVGVYISVKDIVDAPIFVSYEAQKISEDAKPGDKVGKITFDKGAAPITAIEMQGESTDLFDITIDGTITVAEGASFDYESKYAYGFVVIAKNSYGNSMPALVYINIDDVADSPKITDYKGGYIHEDATSGSVVGEVVFDKGGAEIESITLEGAGSQNFTIDIDGVVRVAPNASLDYESIHLYRLIVHVKNLYGTTSQNIFISVIDTLDVPSFVSFSGGNVKENAAVNTVVGQIIFDTGSVPIESISLLGNPSGAFKILDNGTILVAKNILDYEQKNHYVLQATATNAFGSSQVVEIHIFVDDIAERAVVLEDFVVNDIAENVAIETVLGNIEILDNGSGAIYEYEIIGDKKEYFSVDAQGVVRTAKTLDYETDPEYKLKVKARNEAGWSYGVNLIVRLKDVVDEKPSFSASSIYFDVFENDDAIGTISFDAGDSPVTSLTLSGTGSEKLSLDLSGDLRVKAGDILDYDRGQRYFGLSVTATNTAGSSSIPIEINVLNVHDIPEIYDVNLSTVFANMTVDSIIGQINFHTGDSPLTHVKLNGDDAHYFDVDTNGTIRIKTVLESFELKKTYDFTVAFVNSSGESLPKDISVELLGQGDVPVINAPIINIPDNLMVGDIVGTLNILSVGQGEITNFTLSGNGHEKFSIDVNGTITLQETLNAAVTSGYRLFVTANNALGSSQPVSLFIYVLDSDETVRLKGFNTEIYEDIAIGTNIGALQLNISNDNTLNEYIIGGEGKENFLIDSQGIVSIASNAEFNDKIKSNYSLTVKALMQSSQVSNTAYINIRVKDSKEGHPRINPLSITVDENIPIGTVIGRIDVITEGASAIQQYDIKGFSSPYYISINESGEIIVNKLLDYEKIQSFEYEIRAENLKMQSDPVLLKVDINNLPDTPPILGHASFTIEENTPGRSIVGTMPIRYTDDMPIDSFILSGVGKENFTILNDGTIQVAEGVDLDYEKQSYYILGVQASNQVGTSSQVNLNISLTDIGYAVDLLDTNLPINLYQELGAQVGILQKNYNKEAPIENITLAGEYAFMFEADTTGAIFLKEEYPVGMPLSFILSASISNRYGVSDTKNVTIDFFSKKPYILGFQANVDENSVGGTLVGSVPIITHGEAPISSWKLSGNGSEKFNIEDDETIRVAHGANLDYETRSSYELSLQAFNEFGASYKQAVLININDLIDPPTLYNTFLEVEEHRPINTLLGQIDFAADSNCKISSFNVSKESDTIQLIENNVFIDSAGEVYSAINTTFDYEKKRSDYYSVYANTECGQSNTVGLHIDVIDLDENGIVQLNSEFKLNRAYVSIRKIEANGNTNEVFKYYVAKETFNTHKFELEPDSFYIYEFSGGYIYKNNTYEGRFQGKLRTIVKGSWITQIERLYVTPISEAIVSRLLDQKPILDLVTLENDLELLVKEYIHDDIDYNGKVDILDAIAVDISTINDPYAFMQETTFIVRDDILSPMNLGVLNTISMNNGSLQMIELSGEGSEHFEVNENNELILTSSYNDMDQNSYIFEVKSIDILGHKSVANISVTFDPSIYLHSSYKTNSYIYKIAASKEQEILFAAAGEDGVMVFTTQYQNLNPLTFYNTQTNDHIFAPNSKIVALTTYLYGEREILFALNQTTSSLEIVDVTFPEIPVRLSTLALRDFSDIEADLVISADGKYAYIAGAYLEKINIENLTSPLIISDLDLLAEMPYAKQFYIQEEMFGIITLKTWDETYVTYFIDTNNELSFMKDEIMPQELWIEYRPYAKILQKNMLGYTLKWDELIVLSLRERDLYDVVNKSKLNDKSFGNMNDLSFSKYEEYLYIVSTNGKIGMVGFRAQAE